MPDVLDRQLDLEDMYSKANIDRKILKEIDKNSREYCNSMMALIGAGIMPKEIEDTTDALWIEVLRKPEEQHIQSVGTLIGNRLGLQGLEAIEMGCKVLEAASESGLYDLILFDRSKIVRPLMKLDDETLSRLDKLMYQPPMLCVPNPWENNYTGGWLSFQKHVVLGTGNKHLEPQALDVLNKLQEIPWEINADILLKFVDKNRYKGDAEIFIDYLGKPFYFVWRYDKRGRMYSEGYNINLQSSQYRKAMLQFHEKEVITNDGVSWTMIAAANAYGLDRESFNDRIEWFETVATNMNEDQIEEADEPIMFTKAIQAYNQSQADEESGFNMFLDATASGLQIMAALSCCPKTAKAVNMMDGDTRHDVYREVSTEMNHILEENHQVDRKDVKKPVMTHYYNSVASPREHLNNHQLDAFYKILHDSYTGAEDVMESINQCWTDKEVFQWTLPDGHVARVRAKMTIGAEVPFMNGKFWYEYTSYTPSGNSRHLAPNIIHSIDGYIAREMVRRADFRLAHIHDAFTCHPNHAGEMCQLYREIMAEIADSDLLQSILREITGNNSLVYEKQGPSIAQNILNSTYMLS